MAKTKSTSALAKARLAFRKLTDKQKTHVLEDKSPELMAREECIAALEWDDPNGDFDRLGAHDLFTILGHVREQRDAAFARRQISKRMKKAQYPKVTFANAIIQTPGVGIASPFLPQVVSIEQVAPDYFTIKVGAEYARTDLNYNDACWELGVQLVAQLGHLKAIRGELK